MFTVNDVAKIVDGKVLGNGNTPVKGMLHPDLAEEGDMTFALDERTFELARQSRAGSILTAAPVENCSKTVLYVKNLKLAMTVLYNAMLESRIYEKGAVHPSAVVAEDAEIGRNVSIGPNVVIGDSVKVGDNTAIMANCVIGRHVSVGARVVLYPNVTIYEHTVIADRVRIHSGTVIGADGFGYISENGKTYKVPQLGNVRIEEDVEIGANSCVDRGTFGTTVVGRGTKLDNHVQIAHNVVLGKNVLIAGQSAVAGSATVGDNTMVGGQSGISDHTNVGKNVKIGAKTGVIGHVRDGSVVFGYPHRDAAVAKRIYGLLSLIAKSERKFRKFLRELPEKE
ncbi:MAG: UDP-3-O-(3-hydroxymyristoyl)glucosamine N-acyltransferase [Candidatus Omnitrophota bacterium]